MYVHKVHLNWLLLNLMHIKTWREKGILYAHIYKWEHFEFFHSFFLLLRFFAILHFSPVEMAKVYDYSH